MLDAPHFVTITNSKASFNKGPALAVVLQNVGSFISVV